MPCASASPRGTLSNRGRIAWSSWRRRSEPTGADRWDGGPGFILARTCWLRPAHAEGGRHLRLRGTPALAAAGAAEARLGRPVADAARERAWRLGLRARADGARSAARCDPARRGRRPDRVLQARRIPGPTAAPRSAHAPRPRGRVRADGRRARARARPG